MDFGPVQSLLRKILLRCSARRLSPAWLAVIAIALCGTASYAVDHQGYSSTTSELQQRSDKHVAAPEDRRAWVQASTDEDTKHGPAGGTDAARRDLISQAYFGDLILGAVVCFVFNRRYTSSASPRAPPR